MDMRRRLLPVLLLGTAAGLAPGAGSAVAEVTYEQMAANPADLQLSYTYAREQIRSGRLEQAAGALERLLLLEPNWDSARLLYAIVLYRLDDMEGAKRELSLLQGRPLAPNLERQAERYFRMAEKKSQAVRVSGSLSVGVGVDSNPSLASSAEATTYPIDFGEITIGGDEKETDGVFITDARLRVEADLGTGSGNYLYFQAMARINEQFHQSDVDYVRGEVNAGAQLYFDDLSINPEAYYSGIGLGDDLLRTEAGGRLRAEYLVTPGFALIAGGGGAWLDYNEDEDDLATDSRDGWRGWGGGGFRARLGESNTFQAEARYHRRHADEDAFSYRGYEIALSDRHLLGMGQYLLAEVTYWHLTFDDELVVYDDPIASDFDIIFPEREDDRVKARIAYGLPLSTLYSAFGGESSSAIGSLNLQISAGYYWQDSNIPSYDTENWSGELLLTKRFGL